MYMHATYLQRATLFNVDYLAIELCIVAVNANALNCMWYVN